MRAGRIAGLGVFIPLEVCVGHKVGDGLLPVEDGVVPVENRQFSTIISIWVSVDTAFHPPDDLVCSDALEVFTGEFVTVEVMNIIPPRHEVNEGREVLFVVGLLATGSTAWLMTALLCGTGAARSMLLLLRFEDWWVCARLLGLLIGWLRIRRIRRIRLLIWGRMGCFKGCSCLFADAALVAASLGLLASMGCHGCFCFVHLCVDPFVRSFAQMA